MSAVLVQKELPREIEEMSHRIIGRAMEVHRVLGPGLLESIYEEALMYELRLAGFDPAQQVEIVVPYKTVLLDKGQRVDIVVNGIVLVENKSVLKLHETAPAQLLSYLRATRLPLGLLFNFNVLRLKDGMHRVFNERAQPPFRPLLTPSRPSRPSRYPIDDPVDPTAAC